MPPEALVFEGPQPSREEAVAIAVAIGALIVPGRDGRSGAERTHVQRGAGASAPSRHGESAWRRAMLDSILDCHRVPCFDEF